MQRLAIPADCDPVVRARRREIGRRLAAAWPVRPKPAWWVSRGYSRRADVRTADVVHRDTHCPVSDLNVPWRLVDLLGLAAALDCLAINDFMRLCPSCFDSQELATMGTDLAYYTPPQQSLPDRMEYAKQIAASPSMPDKVRGKPESVLLLLDLADALMVRPGVAFTHVHVMDGVPTPDAHLINALVRRAGHRLRIIEGRDDKGVFFATAEIVRKDDPSFTYRVTWDMDRATLAGLANKPAWKSHPQPTLKRRASVECIRDACPEVLMGMDTVTLADIDFVDTEIATEAAAAEVDDIADAELVEDQAPVAQDLLDAREAVKILVQQLGWTNSQMKRAYSVEVGGDMQDATVDQLDKFTKYLDVQIAALAEESQEVAS